MSKSRQRRLVGLMLAGLLATAVLLPALGSRADAAPATALATLNRAFVSSTGSDANLCTLASPCRTFQRAETEVLPGGEIVALDSAGYGPVQITKALTLGGAPGVQASITATANGAGVSINAGATDVVFLHDLTVLSSSSYYGIRFIAGASLHVDDTVISGFNLAFSTTGGIIFQGTGHLYVSDTIIRGCYKGIFITPPNAAAAFATVERVQIRESGSMALAVASRGKAVVRDTVASGGNYGFVASALLGSQTDPGELSLERVVATDLVRGVQAGGFGSSVGNVIRLSNSSVTNNSVYGVINSAGGTGNTIYTRQNNTVHGNATNVSGTLTALGAT